jgi:HEAT repeat protein
MKARYCPICRRVFSSPSSQGSQSSPRAAACPEHGQVLREDPLLSIQVCKFQIQSWLADGLYEATHPSSGVPHLCRVLPQALAADDAPSSLLADLRNASAASQGAVALPVDGTRLPDGRFVYFFVARPAPIEPLAHLVARAPRPLPEAIQAILAVCRAAAACERAGLALRLSAESALLLPGGQGQAFHARLLDAIPARPAPAPGRAPDSARVLHAAGSLLYHLATGVPFEPRTAFVGPGEGLPGGFQAVALRALAQRPEDRYPNLIALTADLEGLLKELDQTQIHPLPPRRGRRDDSVDTALVTRPEARRPSLVLPVLLAGATGGALASGALLLLLSSPSLRPSWLPGTPARERAAVQDPSPPPAPPRPQPQLEDSNQGDAPILVPDDLRARALLLLSEAQRSAEPVDRRRAAHLIGRSADPRLRPLAEELLADLDPTVSARAARALGEIGDPAAAMALGHAAGHGLAQLPAQNAPPAHGPGRGQGQGPGQAAAAPAQDTQLNQEIGVALLRLGDRRGLELLRAVLRGKAEIGRLESALWLGENGEVEAWRALRRLLQQAHDENPLQHLTILGRLCRGRDQAACQQLRERLGKRDGGGLRGQARLLLGAGLMQAGDPLGFQVLSEIGETPELRLPALRWLAEGGLAPLEERWLIALLDNQQAQPAGRAEAAEALGIAGATAALPALAQAMGDKDSVVRLSAAGAVLRLAALEPRRLLNRATEWALAAISAQRGQTRTVAAGILGHGVAPPALAVPILARALTDREAEVRLAAAQALGRLRSPLSAPPLTQALDDREGSVRVAAIAALGRSGSAGADVLRERLERGALLEQVAAAGALLARGETGRRFVLRQALQSPDVAVRRLAVEQGALDPDPKERAALLTLALADTAEEVRLLSALALARGGDRRGIEALRGGGGLLSQRLLSRDALARLGESVPAMDIVAVLGAAGEGQRAGAMAVAPLLQPALAVDLLRRGLRDVTTSVRLSAVGAAAELPATHERRVREQLLLQALSDQDEGVRARAQVLLGRLLTPPRIGPGPGEREGAQP